MLKKISEFFSPKLDVIPLQGIDLSSVAITHSLIAFGQKDAQLPEAGDDAFGRLPLDVQLCIFRYLTAKELCRVASVSKYWNALSSLNTLWKSLSSNPRSLTFQSYKDTYKMFYFAPRNFTENLVRPTLFHTETSLSEFSMPPSLIQPFLRFDFRERFNIPVEVVDTTIYAPDLHPFDDDPSTEDTKVLKLLP